MSREAEWHEAMKIKGHLPRLEQDGSLDYFVYEDGYHNGPGCEICGWSCCWNCESIDDIPECSVLTCEAVEIKEIAP